MYDKVALAGSKMGTELLPLSNYKSFKQSQMFRAIGTFENYLKTKHNYKL